MMLIAVRLVLRRQPAIDVLEQTINAISRFLGPPQSLPFHEACKFGSIELLDWMWSASCTRATDRTPGWFLSNSLRSDPHYHQWQFSRSLKVAADRGDLPMVKWLFSHFSGCEAPASVADEAKKRGCLLVLLFLSRHKTGDQATNEQQTPCSVCYGPRDVFWTVDTIEKACENGQLAQCLDEGMLQLSESDVEIAIKHALHIGDLAFAERLVPAGRSVFDYAAGCTRIEVIEMMVQSGYLQHDVRLAASMIPTVARSGRLDLVECIVQLACSGSKENEDWVATWINAMEVTCRHGHLAVLQWLAGHPSGREALERARNDDDSNCLLPTAAKGGHVEVMEFLYSQGLAVQYYRAMKAAIKKGRTQSAEWLLDHYSFDERELRKLWVKAMYTSVEKGYLELLELFNELDASTPYAQSGVKRKRAGQTKSWWHHVKTPMFIAASEGHLNIFEWFQANPVHKGTTDAMDIAAEHGYLDVVKWLHHNRSEGCTEEAIDSAAGSGRLDVIKWLHANRPEGCSDLAMLRAAENGDLGMVKWLYMNIPESRTETAVDRAVLFSRFRVACWLQPRFPDCKIGSALTSGHPLLFVDSSDDSANTFETLLCLREFYDYVFTSKFLSCVRSRLAVGRSEQRAKARRDRLCYLAEWLEVHYPVDV